MFPIDQASSPVLICDAKTWSTKKQRGAFESCFGNWTVLLGWSDLEPCTRDGVTKSWPTMESASPIKSLPQSWSVMLRLGPPKKKEKSKLFWKLDWHTVWNKSWTVHKRLVTNCWPTMELASPIKSLLLSWSLVLRLGPPKNKEKCVKAVLVNWTV